MFLSQLKNASEVLKGNLASKEFPGMVPISGARQHPVQAVDTGPDLVFLIGCCGSDFGRDFH